MALINYKKKRNFKETLEPKKLGRGSKVKGDIFVIQKHFASRLHYDFRLKIGNVLKSWAIPKRPTGVHGEKKLAVNTEDHPLSYADFSGVIPEGNYGAGKVELWDKGKFKNIRKVSMKKAFEQGKIEVALRGRKLKGNFTLIRTKFNNNPKNWLLIKTKDDNYTFDKR